MFLLFAKLKGIIKSTPFEGVKVIKRALTTELRSIPEETVQLRREALHKRRKGALYSKVVAFKGKPCTLFFGIEIHSL